MCVCVLCVISLYATLLHINSASTQRAKLPLCESITPHAALSHIVAHTHTLAQAFNPANPPTHSIHPPPTHSQFRVSRDKSANGITFHLGRLFDQLRRDAPASVCREGKRSEATSSTPSN